MAICKLKRLNWGEVGAVKIQCENTSVMMSIEETARLVSSPSFRSAGGRGQ